MGCAVATSKPKRRRKGVSTARPYDELSAEAKAQAREWWRNQDWRWDSADSEMLTEWMEGELEEVYGIEVSTRTQRYANGKTHQVPDIEWSLSYCQGDGVNFKAAPDLAKMAEKNDS